MKKQILELIALRPNIRTVEISDQLDIDMERIRPLIDSEIKSGLIVVSPIRAPNGKMVDSFRSTSTVPVVQSKAEAAPVKPVVEAVKPAVEVAKPATKVDAAIEYLRENGPVPNEFLARFMRLPKGTYPSQYLSTALRDGRLIFENKEWRVGTNAVAVPAGFTPSTQAVALRKGIAAPTVAPVIAPKLSEVKAEKVPELAPKADPAPVIEASSPASVGVVERAVHDEPIMIAEEIFCEGAKERHRNLTRNDHLVFDHVDREFLAGLMSTGDLRIYTGSKSIRLTSEETLKLHAYLNKVVPALLAA